MVAKTATDSTTASESGSDDDTSEYTSEERGYIEDDNDMLQRCIFNQNDQWCHDFTDGTIKHIFMDYIGSAEVAEINIVLSDNFEVSWSRAEETNEYLERIGLYTKYDHLIDVRVTRESAMMD